MRSNGGHVLPTAPELRFPGFEGKWRSEPLGDLCLVLNSRRKPITSIHRVSGEYPYYGASGIVDHINQYEFDEPLVLVGEDGAKWASYENTAFIASGKYWVNNHAHVLRPHAVVDALLASYLTMADLAPFVTGAAPPKLTLDKLKKIPIPIPPSREEQQRIADCLLSVDDRIGTEVRTLDAFKAHKKGLMQQLFPTEGQRVPRLRFPGFVEKWDGQKLTDFSTIVRGGSPRPIESFITDADDGLHWLKIGDVEKESKYIERTREKVIPAALIRTRQIHPGDLILSNSMSFGRPYISKITACIHDGWLAIAEIQEQIEPEFLYYFLGSDLSQAYFHTLAAGSGVKNLNAESIKLLPLTFPGKAEQLKIANCLSFIDDLIAAYAVKIKLLVRHKKGLMQGLFPVVNGRGT